MHAAPACRGLWWVRSHIRNSDCPLQDAYNECVHELERFRSQHKAGGILSCCHAVYSVLLTPLLSQPCELRMRGSGGQPASLALAALPRLHPPPACLLMTRHCTAVLPQAFAFSYIAKHSKKADETGTGGSDFMPALQGYRDATARHMLP